MEANPKPKNLVAFMGADARDVAAICRIIEEGNYGTATCKDLDGLKSLLAAPCMAAILDLDSVPLDNRSIRELALAFPTVRFLCASRERSHPHLKEAICHYLFACLHKPVDPDELHYFLRCIRDEETESRGPPKERA